MLVRSACVALQVKGHVHRNIWLTNYIVGHVYCSISVIYPFDIHQLIHITLS